MSDIPRVRLQSIVEGATQPHNVIALDATSGSVVDATATTWTVEAAKSTTLGTIVWTKTTGITPSGNAVTIAWTGADLGALTPDAWALDLNSAAGHKVRMEITVLPEVGT